MTTVQVHCPYCNANLPLGAADAAAARVTCPRCGESFANRPTSDPPTGEMGQTRPQLPGDLPQPPTRLSNAVVARIVVGVMLFAAVVGLAYALATVHFRRENDRKKTPTQAAPTAPVAQTAPVDLPALGYLPADCCIVAGIHTAQILDDPERKRFLDQLRERHASVGFDRLQDWLGLGLEQVDHVAVGLRPDAVTEGAILVIRTRSAYSEEALAKRLAPAVATRFEGRAVYRAQQGAVKRMVWCFDDRTLVVQVSPLAVEVDSLKRIPLSPNTGAAGLSDAIQDLLKHRLDRQSVVWSVGEPAKVKGWGQLLQLLPEASGPVPNVARWVDAFGIGVVLDQNVTMIAALRGKDAGAAASLRGFLEKLKPGGEVNLKLPERDSRDPLWVMVQARTSFGHAAEIIAEPKRLLPK